VLKIQLIATETKNSATSVRGTTIGKRNAAPGSMKTNPAQTAEDKNTGRGDTPQMRRQPRRQFLPS